MSEPRTLDVLAERIGWVAFGPGTERGTPELQMILESAVRAVMTRCNWRDAMSDKPTVVLTTSLRSLAELMVNRLSGGLDPKEFEEYGMWEETWEDAVRRVAAILAEVFLFLGPQECAECGAPLGIKPLVITPSGVAAVDAALEPLIEMLPDVWDEDAAAAATTDLRAKILGSLALGHVREG